MRQPNADNPLTFSLSGAGSIAGVDNADLKNKELYVANHRKAWKGRALVVIRASHRTGKITLSVNSPGLKPASLILQSSAG